MVLLGLVLMVAVAEVVVSAPDKIQMLEKQVEILTNLVHAQSNIMSKFSCQGQASGSNPTSECILKIANQAKAISRLDTEIKSLQSLTKTQGNDIQQLQITISGLSAKLKNQETKLTSLDTKYASEVSKLRSEIQNVNQKTSSLATSVSQLNTKVQQTTDKWPSGSYCILASGGCPAGFTRRSGHMRAINLFAGTATYITQGTFGDSKIQCHGRCGQYGHWIGELYINACCK